MYCETCASIGLMFFAGQMLRIESDAEYADVMERALYNTVISGMALDGRHFFYVNPLEVVPAKSAIDPGKSHVKPIRPQWLGCACCPPNLARLIASLDRYIYTVKEDEILVNLFIRSEMTCNYENGNVTIRQECDYPRTSKIGFEIKNSRPYDINVKIRIPSWADKYMGTVDENDMKITCDRGYWCVSVSQGCHTISLDLEIMPKRWYANAKVSENIGKVAIARGPFVYCAESFDNHEDLHLLELPRNSFLDYKWQDDLLGGVGVIEAEGIRLKAACDPGALYSCEGYEKIPQKIKLIPYYSWANRGENEMRVWINEA